MIPDAQARVKAFIADFHHGWERAGQPPTGLSFDPGRSEAWLAELDQLVDSHCLPGTQTGEEGVLDSRPAHSPSSETVTEIIAQDDQATVRSVVEHGTQRTYFEYRLVLQEGSWRIGRILSFFDPPGAPLVDEGEGERLLAAAQAEGPFDPIDADLELNIPSLFAAGREVFPFGTSASLSVHRLGDISCRSGVLTVRDFGYNGFDLEPLARRVPAGTYPVEVAAVGKTNVALRLRLSDRPAASWHPARRTDGTHVIGVDYGNVIIADLANLVRCEAQQVEELYVRQTEHLDAAPGTTFSLLGDVTDSAIVTSGYGDGAYPCYWGVAADGTLVALVVDFLILTEEKLSTVTAPWRPGVVDVAGLRGIEVEIVEHDGGFTVRHRGGHIRRIRALGPDDSVLMDGDRLGTAVTGDLHSQTWPTNDQPPSGSVLELTVDRGYRHV
ncbi:DUF4241 domain-containing protein [Kribbella sp. CA-294648]|uniref:DUF4241 domain-containing protein n=1 Tax=Kribbella sp. CA-294648 TaxID=3239948 RepID=UPI003D94405F